MIMQYNSDKDSRHKVDELETPTPPQHMDPSKKPQPEKFVKEKVTGKRNKKTSRKKSG